MTQSTNVSQASNSIFQSSWWLDAVAPGHWSRLEVWKGDTLAAQMPVVLKRRFGRTAIAMPRFTQFLGPWLAPPDPGTKYPTMIGQQKELMTQLIDQFPACDYFAQNFHPSITNWQPFFWKGFSATTRYTYVLDDLSDLDRVLAGFQENIRRDIRKAEKKLSVEIQTTPDDLIEVCRRSFSRLGKALPYPEQAVRRLVSAVLPRDAGSVVVARDAEGRPHAAMLYVWDANCTSYVIGGGDPELRNSGATSFLMWHAIKAAAALNGRFDFEGSMIEPVEKFVRAFGGTQTPYFHVRRMKPVVEIADLVRRALARGKH